MTHPFSRPFEIDRFETRLRGLSTRPPFRFPANAVPPDFKRSSVMICFWREADDARVLFTRRAATLRGHAGQMSFPGGGLDEGEDWAEAALRETEEEVGIDRNRIEVLGRLDDAWSGAGHLLAPIVGWLSERPTCIPNPEEVDEIHMPSVKRLFEPEAFTREEAQIGPDVYLNPTLRWEGGHVFGLSTDLLIEAIEWGIGIEEPHGPRRLDSLGSYLRYKASQ